MALYMKIPKDLNGIKEVFIWKMTKRQLIYTAIGVFLGGYTYIHTYKSIGTSTAAVLLFAIAAPLIMFGLYEIHGFTPEKLILNRIRFMLCPKIRPYRTENVYRQITDAIEYKEEVEMLETGRKKVNVNESKKRN